MLVWLGAIRALLLWTPTPNWGLMVHLFRMLQIFGVLRVLFTTSLSPGRIFLIQFSMFACACMILVSHT